MTEDIRKIGVLGCGLMGSGIAEVCARQGFATVVREVDDALLERGMSRIRSSLEKAQSRGKISEADAAQTLARMIATTDVADLAGCDLVIEAVTENKDVKAQIYRDVENVVGAQTILASNTSSLCITELAATTSRPDRFVGLHFFNPVPVMKLVEVIRGLTTTADTFARAHRFCLTLGKEPVAAADRAGFIVNRLLVPYLLDAIRAHEEGAGSIADIDRAMTLGCGYPMGPFTLLDFVGLDTTYWIANIMFDEFREARFAPPALLKRMVLAGKLGRKSGSGFYEYPAK
ncbi:MAG: 3-hydroxybutyryl-CoA dehydrogenase [Candidatus Schekmanbacteria bacterium]|nr:3-hydroxybutyryl-CoA dehydrogenase [Candidatus Schekmanbacteria bacterium]